MRTLLPYAVSAKASKANADAIISLVDSTAANVKLSDASNNKLKEKLVNKNQTPRIGQPKIHTHGLCSRL